MYAFRHEPTKELVYDNSGKPFHTKGGATNGLRHHLRPKVGAWGGRRLSAEQAEKLRFLAAEYHMVSIELVPADELEALREKAARYDDLNK